MALNSQLLSSGNVSDLREEEVLTAQANRQKIQQEVYDLAVNNEMQMTEAAEHQQADRTQTRTAVDTAERAQAQASTSKAFMSMRDDQFERAETALATALQSPGPASYQAALAQIGVAEPFLAKSLPEQYSPKALEQLKTISEAAIRSKSFRQQMAKQGFDHAFQAKQNKTKFAYDSALQEARHEFEAASLVHKLQSSLEELGYTNAAAETRSRIASSPFEIMALEMEKQGLPAAAQGYRKLAAEQAMLELQIEREKAAQSGPDQSVLDARSAKLSEDIAKSVEDAWAGNDAIRREAGWDRQRKKLKASGLKPVAQELFNVGRSAGVPAEQMSGWVGRRMFMDLSLKSKRWKPLAMDSSGNLLGDIGTETIMGWVHKTPSAQANAGWTGGKIDNLKESLKFYRWILKTRHNRTW